MHTPSTLLLPESDADLLRNWPKYGRRHKRAFPRDYSAPTSTPEWCVAQIVKAHAMDPVLAAGFAVGLGCSTYWLNYYLNRANHTRGICFC